MEPNTTTSVAEIAFSVEVQVQNVFSCRSSDISGFLDTLPKKVVVFFLSKFYSIDRRLLARKYNMTYLFVPAVVDEIEIRMLLDTAFRNQIIRIGKSVGYVYDGPSITAKA